MNMQGKPLFVPGEKDEYARGRVAASDDVPGLAAEKETMKSLAVNLNRVIHELLEVKEPTLTSGPIESLSVLRGFLAECEGLKRKSFLNFSPPNFGPEEFEEVMDTLRSDWITTGPKTRRFEEEFAGFVEAEAALAVNSCTDAMLVGLAALGLRPGDSVITTAMTFCSTVHVIEHLGARPVLVDVEPDTLNIDPQAVEKAITQLKAQGSKVKGIMPVHLYGHPCEMDKILDLAEQYNLFVLEDAAHALPAKYRGRKVGGIGDLTAFSFYATKNLTTAEGGMLTGSKALLDKARPWTLHGMSRDAYKRYSAEGSWYYEVILPGFKCNLTDIQASLGLQQLKKLPGFQVRRGEIVERYNRAFSGMEEIQVPTERSEVESSRHLYVLRLNLDRLNIDRNRFIEELKARNISTSVHFIPIHLHPYYRDKYGYKPEDFPVAFENFQRIISLPLHPRMTDQEVEDVIEAVRDVVDKFRKKVVREIRNRRVAPRFRGRIPVEFGYGNDNLHDGMTRDFSTSGISFETEADLSISPGQRLEFTLLLAHYHPGQLVRIHCSGEVVRIKGKVRKDVAVTISSSWFHDIQEKV